ncbi:hypothetical protein Msi02_05970 [Microbispora siamensis]|uniref:Sensor histidine kinase n=1 Tax=Microbispora siamensis TaxID=564413 RepID=A0ABQ4GEC1_9ACTN|nr:hypothetical protein Msi02_05970 [Microbispora siamensis]
MEPLLGSGTSGAVAWPSDGPYGWAGLRLIRTAVGVLSHEAVQVTGDGTALVPFQLAWKPNVVDAPEPTEPL